LGSVLPFDAKGMDFPLTALFVTIFVQNWKENKDHFPALLGVFATLVCLLVFGKDIFLIPTMLIICAVLCLKIVIGGKGCKK
jgi:4-azaleucine resistance transporter AzlC